MDVEHYDWIVIGSGFGGSVSALRLAEKGYRVLVIEKGRRFGLDDFPKTNWDLRKWMWGPKVGMHGFFQMTVFKHVTVLHGVGVGGGSLTYANTLPVPSKQFFESPSWSHLADWGEELAPHYKTAQRMLGSAPNPHLGHADRIVEEMAADLGREEHFRPTDVGVFFGPAGETVKDPYFDNKGPDRVGCTLCGACLTGCRVGAKNTLDKNYLYLAEGLGTQVRAETEVTAVRPRAEGGYAVYTEPSLQKPKKGPKTRRKNPVTVFTADKIVFAGGVMGTVPLLLSMRDEADGLPNLSPRLGDFVRTNNEALVGIVVPDSPHDFTKGVAIGSILHTDEDSHFEPIHYGRGSGFFRLLAMPHTAAPTRRARLVKIVKTLAKNPRRWAKALFAPGMSTKALTVVFMQTLDSTLSLRLKKKEGKEPKLVTHLDDPNEAPTPFIEGAEKLIKHFTEKVGGVPVTMATEFISAVPTTAHILGGCCMGTDAETGVIDSQHRVFGHDGLYVIDGSAVSSNPGVNPSLSITALAERAMSLVPPREQGVQA